MRLGAIALLLMAMSLPLTARAEASFPGANGEIAFTSDRPAPGTPADVDPGHLFAIHPDGHGERPLHTAWRSPYAFGDQAAAWSPDGERVAYASDEETGAGYLAIYVMNADGSGVRRLTPLVRTSLSPAWSPDGARILFSVLRQGRGDLHVIDADGGSERRLTRLESVVEVDGVWSPDGRQIALTFGDRFGDIGLIDAEGSGALVNLTRTTGLHESLPDWSPDGRQLAFQSIGFGSSPRWDVHVMNRDGSGRVEVTHGFGAGAVAPVWSPDGGQIAFSARVSDNQDIFTLDVADGEFRRVTTHPAVDTRPDWQPIARPPGPTSPAAAQPPKIAVRGAPRGCARRAFTISVTVGSGAQPTRVTVALDRRSLRRTSRSRFRLRIPAQRLAPGRHRIVVRAADAAGNRSVRTIVFRRCR